MKNKKIIIGLIIFLVLIFLIGSFFFIKVLIGKDKSWMIFSNYKVSEEKVFSKEYDNVFNEVNIVSDFADINVKESESAKVKVVIYGKKGNFKVSTDENLNIKIKREDCRFFCLDATASKVDVYLPKDFSKKIKIENNYGDIKVASFLESKVDLSNDCGDVLVKEVKNAKIKVDYGDIKVERIESGEVENDCGDIYIGEVKTIKTSNSYGDIEIGKVLSELNIENDCGDISIDEVNLNKDSFIKDDYGDINIGKTNEIFIDAKVDLGDVEINKNYRKSLITLQIKNDCGDIIVDN